MNDQDSPPEGAIEGAETSGKTATSPATPEVNHHRRDALLKLLRVTGYIAPATIVALGMTTENCAAYPT